MKTQNCQIGSHRIAQEQQLDLDATDSIPEIEGSRCFMCLLFFDELTAFNDETICNSCHRKLGILMLEENYQATKLARKNKRTR